MIIYPIQCKFNTFANSYVRSIRFFQHEMNKAILKWLISLKLQWSHSKVFLNPINFYVLSDS